jgi:hypothetical protein
MNAADLAVLAIADEPTRARFLQAHGCLRAVEAALARPGGRVVISPAASAAITGEPR